MAAAAGSDPSVPISPCDVPVKDLLGMSPVAAVRQLFGSSDEEVAAAGTPSRTPLIKQYIGTPAELVQKKMDDDAARVQQMQKKIEDLE